MSLAAAFAKGNGRKIKVDGTTIHSMLRIAVSDGTKLRITRLRASATRAQALKLAADRGDLRCNGVVVPSLAIWSHTAPENVTVDVVGRRVRTVDLWNSWSFDGVDSSWLANAGMQVATTGSTHELRCSDGLGPPTFDDLVVRVELVGHG